MTDNFQATGKVKWTVNNIDHTSFAGLKDTLPVSGSQSIDLSAFSEFPKKDTNRIVILQQGIVDSYNTNEEQLKISNGQVLTFYHDPPGEMVVSSKGLTVVPIGPRVRIKNTLVKVNGYAVKDTMAIEPNGEQLIETRLEVWNSGSDISSNTIVSINMGDYYHAANDKLPGNATVLGNLLKVDMGSMVPGEKKEATLHFLLSAQLPEKADIRTIIE
ncbi:MAG: hypothetical protein HC896_08435 [Bacteroidales bacterium]|nr:hypothetical protein [Bacteroidales bacterium]